ncbi:MAG: S9 family peptidase, partial [Gammaproteobacteria bacterium]
MTSRSPCRDWLLSGLLSGLLFGLLASPWMLALGAVSPRLPVSTFGALPFMAQAEISPDGRYVAALVVGSNRRYDVVVYELAQLGKVAPFRAPAGDWDVNWIHWKSANRLLVSTRKPFFRAQPGQNADVIETRLWAMNADGSELKRLVQPKSAPKSSSAESIGGQRMVQIADRVVDFLSDDPRHVLMAFNAEDPSRPRLYQVDIFNDKQVQIEPANTNIQWWVRDNHGQVRLAQGQAGYDVGTEVVTYYRATEKDAWRQVWDEKARNGSFNPVIFDKNDGDVLYVTSDHENGRLGLYRYRLSNGEFIEKLFLHPQVDIDEVVIDPQGVSIDGVSYITELAQTEWFSVRMADIYKDLRTQLPGWAIAVVSRSLDDARMVVHATAPDHSPRYYLYDTSTRKVQFFSYTYADLDQHDLAPMIPVRYKARDGLEIPAYLTLPSGVQNPPAQPLPAVVMPHGGPEARDYAAFDAEVQMLANHGYAVLQMNFRGSKGYGTEFKEAGQKEWGEAMQDDITDGTRWLVASRIADPKRICIVGGSYGGYAALMGVVKEPGLYRCAVSLNGVTDLPDLVNLGRKYVGGRRSAARRIGDLWQDRDKLARNSPARRADDIQVPVLLVHGTDDRVVPIAQSQKMAAALKNARKNYQYVELDGEEHWLTHADTRLRYFEELDKFID